MLTSDYIQLFHWIIYIGSILSVVVLFTRFRKWGALWIAILFASQALFNGCLIVAWENYYRIKEGLPTIPKDLLVDRFSSNHTIEILISAGIAVLALLIFILSLDGKKNYE